MRRKPMMLMILDGFGSNENEKANAINIANTPNIDRLMKKYPNKHRSRKSSISRLN